MEEYEEPPCAHSRLQDSQVTASLFPSMFHSLLSGLDLFLTPASEKGQKNPQAGPNSRGQRLPPGWWPHPGVRDRTGDSRRSGDTAVSMQVVLWGQPKDPRLWEGRRSKPSHTKTSKMLADSGGGRAPDPRGDCHEPGKVQSKGQVNTVSACGPWGPSEGWQLEGLFSFFSRGEVANEWPGLEAEGQLVGG